MQSLSEAAVMTDCFSPAMTEPFNNPSFMIIHPLINFAVQASLQVSVHALFFPITTANTIFNFSTVAIPLCVASPY